VNTNTLCKPWTFTPGAMGSRIVRGVWGVIGG